MEFGRGYIDAASKTLQGQFDGFLPDKKESFEWSLMPHCHVRHPPEILFDPRFEQIRVVIYLIGQRKCSGQPVWFYLRS